MPSNRSYGGLTYDSEPATPYHSTEGQLAKLAVLVGAGAAAGYKLTRTDGSGFRPIDAVAGASRYGGNLSPFQILNTFRIPDILSPFTSMGYKRLNKRSAQGVTFWDKSYLKSQESYDWLKYTTGKTTKELEDLGITRGMRGPDNRVADAILFEQGKDSISGKLYSVFGGEFDSRTGNWVGGSKKLLSKDVVLQSMSQEVTNVLTGRTGVNRITAGMFAAADMYSSDSFDEQKAFRGEVLNPQTGEYVKRQASYMPAPSPTGSIRSFGDLKRRTTLIRGLQAFGMDRFNRLVDGAAEQFFGEKGGKAVSSILGTTPGVRPGPASAMYARFGSKVALAGAAVMGVSQLDWMRRQFSMPGQITASGLMSLGLSFASRKFGAGPRNQMFIGLGSFAGQMLLPGFDQGVMQGIATTAVNLDVARATAINPFNYYRRTVEGFLPGVSDWQTGALLGIGGIMASTVKIPTTGTNLANYLLETVGPRSLGLGPMGAGEVSQMTRMSRSVRDLFYEEVSEHMAEGAAHQSFADRRRMMARIRSDYKDNTAEMYKNLNARFYAAEERLKEMREKNPMTEALQRKLRNISADYGSTPNILQRFQMEARGLGAQAYYSFFGADLSQSKALRRNIGDMGFKVAGRWGKWASIFGGVLATQQLLTGGLLGSKETAEDLREIYSGRKLVAVKSSRYWEAGGTPFEGSETKYYRPHQYHLMMNRVRERGIYGDDEDSISPIGKFFKKNFTYDLEMQNYYSRPYPISAPAFADVPIIGGALAATIGQIIKPSRVMHAGEYIQPGEDGTINYGSVYRGSRMEPAHALGEGHGIPYTPFGAEAQLGMVSYQFRELEGMTGWAKNTVQKLLTGSPSFTPDGRMLADSSLMTSSRVRFWEMQMGGAFFTNEFVRRIFPSYRAEIERTNPIANSMPSWMPDKFKYGDPYRKVEWGEARLPGAGFAALHPELKGLDPEAYPLLYRYAILSDIAPLSKEYHLTKKMVYQNRADGVYNQREIAYMERTDRRHAEQVSGFSEDRLHERAIRLPGSSLTRSAYARGQEFARSAVAPAEYLIPMGFRPMQKLMPDRGMIEQYEFERLYGTPLAFWDKPWRDWLRPSMYSALNMMGYEGKPVWRAQADAANQYFDSLEFMKYANLREQAELSGDRSAADRYRYLQSNTRAGVNPQGSPLSIYWTLPEAERKFFNAFAHASGKDRHRIAEMVPEDQVHLYRAIWSRMDAGDETLYAGADTAISDAYLAQRQAEIARGLEGQPQPGVDWVGWHEDVDMQDIKVRYINQLGAELADYGAWEKQLKKSMQQTSLEGSADFIFDQGSATSLGMGMRNSMNAMSGVSGGRGNWNVTPWRGTMSSVQLQYNDNRQLDVGLALERYIGGY